jgi:tetratricopeptide (TPR) repeat protein
MVRQMNGRQAWRFALASLAALSIALPALAQSTGMIRGTIKDEKGQPVEGAKVTIEAVGGSNRHYETKTGKKGDYIQIGLMPGAYRVTVEKEKVGTGMMQVNVRVSTPAEVNLTLGGGAAGPAGVAELRKAFEDGVNASKAGNFDDAVAAFAKAAEISPKCPDCYYNMGYAYSQKKDYAKAEESYKKAIEMKPDYPEAYSGLANIYNAQRKFDDAAAASAKAAELSGGAPGALAGGNADALFNQGVILWNAGKIADAKKQFEAAVAANPSHAEAHYQLGMALVNEGNLSGAAAEFDKYLELAPNGPNAAQAKALVAQLKK